jgi:hypothetical protein
VRFFNFFSSFIVTCSFFKSNGMNIFKWHSFSFILLAVGAAAFILLTSTQNGGAGVNNAAGNNTNCSPCHGNTPNANTLIVFNGVPNNTYTPGLSYPVSLTINNPTMAKCGFSLFVSDGTLADNPVGTALTPLSLNQIRHTTPLLLVGGEYTCNFIWTAPTTGAAVTVKVVANAVNGNGKDDAGDQWNSAEFTLLQAPNAVDALPTETTTLYPNPASTSLIVDTKCPANIEHVVVNHISGQFVTMPVVMQQGRMIFSVNQLDAGYYQIAYYQQGKLHRIAFLKK